MLDRVKSRGCSLSIVFSVSAILSLSACGGSNGSSSDAAGNHAPSITGSAPALAEVGKSYVFKPTGSDADNDNLTFSIESKPTWVTFDAKTGMLSGTPTEANIGSHEEIVLRVSDGKVTAALPKFAVTVISANAVASNAATLSWEAPTVNVDGSALVNLTGYKIHYGTKPGTYSKTISINSVGLTTYVIDDLTSGTYYFAVTAITASGVESEFSGEATKTIG